MHGMTNRMLTINRRIQNDKCFYWVMIHIKRSRYPDQLRNRAFQHTQEPQTLRIVLYLFGLARRGTFWKYPFSI